MYEYDTSGDKIMLNRLNDETAPEKMNSIIHAGKLLEPSIPSDSQGDALSHGTEGAKKFRRLRG